MLVELILLLLRLQLNTLLLLLILVLLLMMNFRLKFHLCLIYSRLLQRRLLLVILQNRHLQLLNILHQTGLPLLM